MTSHIKHLLKPETVTVYRIIAETTTSSLTRTSITCYVRIRYDKGGTVIVLLISTHKSRHKNILLDFRNQNGYVLKQDHRVSDVAEGGYKATLQAMIYM